MKLVRHFQLLVQDADAGTVFAAEGRDICHYALAYIDALVQIGCGIGQDLGLDLVDAAVVQLGSEAHDSSRCVISIFILFF